MYPVETGKYRFFNVRVIFGRLYKFYTGIIMITHEFLKNTGFKGPTSGAVFFNVIK